MIRNSPGKPITVGRYLERLIGDLAGTVAEEGQPRATWSDPVERQRFLERLVENGRVWDRLDDLRQLVDPPDSGLSDVLACVQFNNPQKIHPSRPVGAQHRNESASSWLAACTRNSRRG